MKSMSRFANVRKLSTRLLRSISLLAYLCLLIAGVSYYSTNKIISSLETTSNSHLKPMGDMAYILDAMGNVRAGIRQALITPTAEEISQVHEVINASQKQINTYSDSFSAALSTTVQTDAVAAASQTDAVSAATPEQERFTKVLTQMPVYFDSCRKLIDLASSGSTIANSQEMTDLMESIQHDEDFISSQLKELFESKITAGDIMVAGSQRSANINLIINISLFVVFLLGVILIGRYIAGIIVRPLKEMTRIFKEIEQTGDTNTFDNGDAGNLLGRKDEIGQAMEAFHRFLKMISARMQTVELLAHGDLSIPIEVRSEQDVIGLALVHMRKMYNEIFVELGKVSSHVAQSSRQISQGSAMLANGSVEQASAIEQLSASITDINAQTQHSASQSETANMMTSNIRAAAEGGTEKMHQMVQAVQQIDHASNNISRIIKVIDDIAFQTNILALNAAVEAAHAGQHGKGFAVVAEEVKTLASRSATAAKETTQLIEQSIQLAADGVHIADQTQESLRSIVEQINEVASVITTIADTSSAQAEAVSQINKGIERVSHVVHSNSATAQQSAASSQEMSAQADVLDRMVARIKINNTDAAAQLKSKNDAVNGVPALSPAKPSALSKNAQAESLGKY